jgi:hypothetical protein
MGGNLSKVDPRVLEDFRIVEQGCTLFRSAGVDAEFWQTFILLKTNRDRVQAEIDRLSGLSGRGALDPRILEGLAKIKAKHGLLVRKMGVFLGQSSLHLDGERANLAIVFLMGSPQVSRWVTDPEGSATEYGPRLKTIGRLVEAYRTELFKAQVAAPRASENPVDPAGKPDFVNDLRRVDRCRRLLEALEPVLGWELNYLLLTARSETRRMMVELERPGEFPGAADRFRQDLLRVRAQHGDFVKDLRAYLDKLYGGWGGEEDELALSFLMASSQGRARARQWMDEPDLNRGEATASMNGLRKRARGYLGALTPSA